MNQPEPTNTTSNHSPCLGVSVVSPPAGKRRRWRRSGGGAWAGPGPRVSARAM